MFRDILEFLGYKCKQVIKSRLFPLTLLFCAMFIILIGHLFQLQIVEGEQAQEEYTQTTKKTVSLPSTRGNIYDCNGKLLAYNKLVYVVTVTDNGDYANGYEKNVMLLQLVRILDKYNETLTSEIPIIIDRKGNFRYTVEGNTLLRFLRDMYGFKSIDDFTETKPASTTAREAFEYMKNHYGVGKYSRKENDTYDISDEDALKVINIRFGLSMNSYQKYVPTTIAEDISTKTVQDILEHSTELLGVEVVEDYVREYTDSVCFSHIIGYTGKASSEEIESLNQNGNNYSSGDIIGKTGIESYCETDLQGEKGERVMYVDSEGHITSVLSETTAVTGSDIYLTIDADLQVGLYHLIEQQLAGIILDKLSAEDVTILPTMKSSERKIGIKEVYFQLINNNILDMNAFSDDNASACEKRIYQTFTQEQKDVLEQMSVQLTSAAPSAYQDLSEDMQAYMTYTYSTLEDNGILITSKVNTSDDVYIAYHKDEDMSLEEFLRYALSQSWIDTAELELNEKYTSAEETYQALVKKTLELLRNDSDFTKKIYEQLIHAEQISGCDICLALFEQGILEKDENAIASLETGSAATAYQFMQTKIRNLEITPAQLALDPCSAAVTIVDSKTGTIKAIVSYPGYDNNRISDSSYYYSLSNDLAHPLYSSAAQTRTAPGSAFKLVSTIAGLEENILDSSQTIFCDGIFTKQGLKLACTGYHGYLDVESAIQKSCNVFFSEVGFQLSLDSQDNYSESQGVSMIQKYSAMVGLSEKSGAEVTEMEPKVSDSAPIPSAIGQGTHAYTNVQLARYAATLATSGTVYDLTLLDRITDISGKVTKEFHSDIVSTADISLSTWDIVHKGMYRVVAQGDHRSEFTSSLKIAGKTGTAEENKMRPNHATFVGYAPYDNPEYAIAVTIPYGFSSTYSCRLANSSMELLYGMTTLNDILGGTANTSSGTVSDD
ncbi:MAG: penicillin-binding transpeptidase domain-containing protein [Clostridiales bacterium]|nr:penicillin-binding transpeptidase domain-containing protein [Clostridiales bacterium]